MESDPNVWTNSELISLAMVAGLYLLGLVFSVWSGFRAMKWRIYWKTCAAMMLVGALGALVSSFYSLDEIDMPTIFDLSLWLLLAGQSGAVIGACWVGCSRLSQRLTKTSL
ncbi:hypothetical protein RGU70_02950 [Herbaspirillum sp. RTI4]|uniref:hypothetical protein n=1 Tax=Herbaspirillum sp. RTI4 TaxID=3048640 RepID=UPI002AB5C233|nr:hypothetical protein [Herbaspirillum sp. RTI4]MDY7577287.1 hypothetical protein [Herbaspirillum sp. RTI4]MEA9982947.1 hypothetical protein [Herbaspirillum sp. RTI4]